MTYKVVKSTVKGQITLPMDWRSKFSTENFILQIEADHITVKPIEFNSREEIFFDAATDNAGKGIPVKEMIKMLKDLNGQN